MQMSDIDVKFYYHCANNTMCEINGDTMDNICNKAQATARLSPYGMLLAPMLIRKRSDGSQLRSWALSGRAVHVGSDGISEADISDWSMAALADQWVSAFFANRLPPIVLAEVDATSPVKPTAMDHLRALLLVVDDSGYSKAPQQDIVRAARAFAEGEG
jgi:hypothetical protein